MEVKQVLGDKNEEAKQVQEAINALVEELGVPKTEEEGQAFKELLAERLGQSVEGISLEFHSGKEMELNLLEMIGSEVKVERPDMANCRNSAKLCDDNRPELVNPELFPDDAGPEFCAGFLAAYNLMTDQLGLVNWETTAQRMITMAAAQISTAVKILVDSQPADQSSELDKSDLDEFWNKTICGGSKHQKTQ